MSQCKYDGTVPGGGLAIQRRNNAMESGRVSVRGCVFQYEIPFAFDDDEDYTIAITPVLSTKDPVDSLIMEDEHLDTITATESDEVIKSSIEELVPIPSKRIENGAKT
ncbi:hypothetical protein Tco_0646216, partial [Tanacetum coccineum]